MITDADVKKLERKFATKEYIDKKLDTTEKNLRKEIRSSENYFGYKVEAARKENEDFLNEFHVFKDSVLKTLDWLVSAFTKFNEEHTVLSEQTKRTSDKLDNHEKRILSLEQRILTA